MKIDEIHLLKTDSTNTWVKTHKNTFNRNHLTCVTAQEQSAGRGRQGSSWFSPAGENIYASFFFSLPEKNSQLHVLPALLCLTSAKVLLQFNISPEIKWPNDLLLKGKKIGGVLCETTKEEDRFEVVIGIGLNVNSSSEQLDQNVSQPATSLFEETQQLQDCTQIFNCLKKFFALDLSLFFDRGFEPFAALYQSFLREIGKRISFTEKGKNYEGICRGITQDGYLNVLLDNGSTVKTHSDRLKLL